MFTILVAGAIGHIMSHKCDLGTLFLQQMPLNLLQKKNGEKNPLKTQPYINQTCAPNN